METLVTVITTALVTVLVEIFAVNFVTSEKRLALRPRRLYGIEKADFTRALGVLVRAGSFWRVIASIRW